MLGATWSCEAGVVGLSYSVIPYAGHGNTPRHSGLCEISMWLRSIESYATFSGVLADACPSPVSLDKMTPQDLS